jgi:hypothetical protein
MQGVLTLDESTGEAKQEGAAADSNVPSGDNDDGEKSAGDSALRDGVQTPRAEPSSSPGISLGNFDVLASLNEPEQFALELKKYAEAIVDPRWQAISRAMKGVIEIHEHINAVSKR